MSFLRRLGFGSRDSHGQRGDPLPHGEEKRAEVEAKKPSVAVRNFLTLTEGEACLICEVIGGEYMTRDSRLTILERLISAIDEDWQDTSIFFLEYWTKNGPVPTQPLIEKLSKLNGTQARSVISAARRAWKAWENDVDYRICLTEAGLL